jgi:hypothetical protein
MLSVSNKHFMLTVSNKHFMLSASNKPFMLNVIMLNECHCAPEQVLLFIYFYIIVFLIRIIRFHHRSNFISESSCQLLRMKETTLGIVTLSIIILDTEYFNAECLK